MRPALVQSCTGNNRFATSQRSEQNHRSTHGGPKLVKVGPNLSEFGPASLGVDENLAASGPKLTDIGRRRSKAAELGPELVKVGRPPSQI